MPLSPQERRLLRLSKASASDLKMLKEGVSVEAEFSRRIDDLVAQVAVDRLGLADEFLAMAEALKRSRRDLSRASIARYYYSMYHAMRAVSYYAMEGDDFEQHTILSLKGVPKDYPNRGVASNALKDARLRRNEADYDPYPLTSTHFQMIERSIAPQARIFVADARAYVRSKGNPYA